MRNILSETSSMERNLKRLRELGFDENFLIPENLITFEKDDKGKRILIGRGAYGKVFQAILFGNKIALKESHNNGLYEEYDEDMLKDARNEISNLSKIKHQNIVKYVGFCLPASGRLWILTELIGGGNLDTWLRNTKFPNKNNETFQKLLVSHDVCEVMKFLKENEIFHRDLKPKNILMDMKIRPEAKVCDFGLARNAYKSTRHTGAGTMGYAAPEIAFAREGIRSKFSFDSDVYSFGVLLYEIFVGNPVGCPLKLRNLRKINELPGVKKIIERCCKEDPDERISIEKCRKLIEKDLGQKKYAASLKDLVGIPLYMKGDTRRAFRMLRTAALNDLDVGFEIAKFLLNPVSGFGEKSEDVGVEIIERLVEDDHLEAQLMMADIYLNGKFGFRKNKKKSLDLFESVHRLSGGRLTKDKVDVTYKLARFFRKKSDHKSSVRCCQIGVDHNHAESRCELGYNYDYGFGGLEKNDEKAFELYKKSADQNYARAQYNLGIMYRNGRGTSQNYAKAMEYYQKAADQNYAIAINNLGAMYENGEGCEVDFQKAFSLYIKAAESREVMAYYNLGEFYRKGLGGSVDKEKAIGYFEKVAAARDRNDERKEHWKAKISRKYLRKLKRKEI